MKMMILLMPSYPRRKDWTALSPFLPRWQLAWIGPLNCRKTWCSLLRDQRWCLPPLPFCSGFLSFCQIHHCQDKTRYRIFVQWCPHEIFSFGGHCSDLTVLDGYVFLFCFVFSFPLNVEPIWSQCLLMCCWVVSSRGSKFAVSRARRFLFHQRSRFPSLRFP